MILHKGFGVLIVLCTALSVQGQKLQWKIIGLPSGEINAKDSTHAAKLLDSLALRKYHDLELVRTEKTQSLYKLYISPGKNYQAAVIQPDSLLRERFKLAEELVTQDLDSLQQKIHRDLLAEGFAFNRVTAIPLSDGTMPKYRLTVYTGERRMITDIRIRGYEKIPKRFVQNLKNQFVGKAFDERHISEVNALFSSHPMVGLERPPQALYSKEGSELFLFLTKRKSNSFDGMIGFGNDRDEKFRLNGHLNFQLRNVFNAFEQIDLFWQRSPENAQTFRLHTHFPYMFNSNVGTEVSVDVFRQDSEFANFKFIPAVTYQIDWRQRIGLQFLSETSSVSAPTSALSAEDYTKTGAGLQYSYFTAGPSLLMPSKSLVRAEVRWMKLQLSEREMTGTQWFSKLNAERLWHLRGPHYISTTAEATYLKSNIPYFQNELPRFGGWNSLRGFNENFLIANAYAWACAEYRLVTGDTAFFDVFGMGGYLVNNTLGRKTALFSFGTGFSMILPVGLMSFQLASGHEPGTPFRFGDIKIHWGLITRF